MKVLWIIRNTMPYAHYDAEFVKSFEKVIGKDNVSFYGKEGLPTHDTFGIPYYPEKPLIPNRPFSEIVKEEEADIIVNDGQIDADLKEVNVPKIMFISDAHSEWQNRKQRFANKEFDVPFLRSYGGGIGLRAKQEFGAVGYCPRSVSLNVFYDTHYERENTVYLLGYVNLIYPIRQNIFRVSQKTSKEIEGIKFVFTSATGIISPREFLKILGTSKISIFDCGMFKYPIMKIFEGMATNTLCLCDLPYDYEALRLQPDVNLVEITMTNFVDKIRYYLDNDDERKRIAKNGLELVQKYHSTEVRAKQLIEQLEEVIRSKNEGRVFDSKNLKNEIGRMFNILERNEEIFNRNSLLHKCMDNTNWRIPFNEWESKALPIWNGVVSGKANVSEWEKYVKETQ